MQKLRLGLEWFLNPDHLPFLIGQRKGWFKDAGIELELIEPAEHLDAVDAIARGEMEVAITEPLHLVEDKAKGDAVVGFARFLHTNGGVMFLRNAGIERPRDMVGKRIQYPGAPGPGGPAIVGTMVRADGGDCTADDFERVNNSFYHTDALLEDKADVATLAFYNFEVVEARHRGVDADFFALKDWGVPDFCQLILITSPALLEEKREVFDALLKVMGRGIDFIHQHPKEARAIYNEATENSLDTELGQAIFDATVPCFTFDFSMSEDYYGQLETWMAENALIKSRPGKANYWTNALVLR